MTDINITANMTPDMKSVYSDFYGNMERLKAEWKLCDSQYTSVLALAMSKDGDLKARQSIRKISDYWIRRRQALERSISKEILESFKK